MPEIEHDESKDLWDCPCRECWRLEQDLIDHGNVFDDRAEPETYAEWKENRT